MTFVTIAVTAFVIVYLFTALVRPEWFWRRRTDRPVRFPISLARSGTRASARL